MVHSQPPDCESEVALCGEMVGEDGSFDVTNYTAVGHHANTRGLESHRTGKLSFSFSLTSYSVSHPL